MEFVDTTLVSDFVAKLRHAQTVLLLTPPLFLSEPEMVELRKNAAYLTLNDIVVSPASASEEEKPHVLLHLYFPPKVSQSAKVAEALRNCRAVVVAGYEDGKLSFERFVENFEVRYGDSSGVEGEEGDWRAR